MNRRSGIVLAAKSKEGHRPGQISLRRLRATSVAYNSGAASATPIAALSGANHKAPGFAGESLLVLALRGLGGAALNGMRAENIPCGGDRGILMRAGRAKLKSWPQGAFQ